MKKLILVFLVTPFIGFGQKNLGTYMTTGGVIFTLASLSTPNETVYNASEGRYIAKPLFQQGAKTWCLVGGITLTVTGGITYLASRR